MALQKSTKSRSDLKVTMALTGPPGSGKTYSALSILTQLAKKVAIVDTEADKALWYDDVFEFDHFVIEPPYHPDKFRECISDAHEAGYDGLVVDSFSHAWNKKGGMLDVVEEGVIKSKTRNQFAGWKDAKPHEYALIDMLVAAPLHLIITMRTDNDYAIDVNDKTGKKTYKKVGLKPVQRAGIEYELDHVGEMDAGTVIFSKSRCSSLSERVFKHPGKEVADILKDWIEIKPRIVPSLATRDQLDRIKQFIEWDDKPQRKADLTKELQSDVTAERAAEVIGKYEKVANAQSNR